MVPGAVVGAGVDTEQALDPGGGRVLASPSPALYLCLRVVIGCLLYLSMVETNRRTFQRADNTPAGQSGRNCEGPRHRRADGYPAYRLWRWRRRPGRRVACDAGGRDGVPAATACARESPGLQHISHHFESAPLHARTAVDDDFTCNDNDYTITCNDDYEIALTHELREMGELQPGVLPGGGNHAV